MTYDLFVILLSDRTHRTRRNVLASASPHYLVPGYSWWAKKVRLPRSRCRAGAKNAKRKDRKCRCKKCIKKLHKMQLTRGKGVRDKKKGPFKMVEKVSPLPSALVTGFFSRHKMQEILPGKNRKMQKMQHSRGNALQKKTQKKKKNSRQKTKCPKMQIIIMMIMHLHI